MLVVLVLEAAVMGCVLPLVGVSLIAIVGVDERLVVVVVMVEGVGGVEVF